jgi:phage terminase large subunit GpA-like protein
LGGTATFVGGASASPLAFRTVWIVILDEIDKLRVLPGEGDADALASKRVSTYGTDFKILRFSKPTVEGSSRIHRHYRRGSQALYYIGCPACNAFQELGWASLRFDDMHLRCTACDGFFDQDSCQANVGEWRETAANPHHKSFQCSALISPLIRWETLVEEYRAAVHAL